MRKGVMLVSALALLAYLPYLVVSQFLYPLGIHEWDYISGNMWGREPLSFAGRWWYWQQHIGGRYLSTALLSTMPDWYTLARFRIVALLFLLSVPISLVFSSIRLLPLRFGLFCASLIWMLHLDHLTNIYDSLLRFTCLPIYHLGMALLLLLAMWLYQEYHRGFHWRWYTPIWLVVALLIPGTNEVTLVHQFLLLFFVGFLSWKHKGQIPLLLIAIIVISTLGALLALGAPGNFARMDYYPAAGNLMRTLWITAATSIFLIFDWLVDSMLLPVCAVIVLAKYHWWPSLRISLFHNWKFWAAALILLCPLSLFPLLYGTGGASLPERIVDLLFLVFSILFIATVLSGLQDYDSDRGRIRSRGMLSQILGGGLLLFIVGKCFFGGLNIDRSPDRDRANLVNLIKVESNIGIAYQQMLQGVPQKYAEETAKLEELIVNCRVDTCWVAPLSTPMFIGYDPLYDRMHQKGEYGIVRYLSNNPVARVAKYRPSKEMNVQ